MSLPNVYVYPVLFDERERAPYRPAQLQSFNDYTSDNANERLTTPRAACLTLRQCSRVHAGHDVHPDNTYIHNRLFGVGNTMLVEAKYRGRPVLYHICDETVRRYDARALKGRITGYISPIGNNDVPYAILFTSTHMYAWCGSAAQEHPLPTDAAARDTMHVLRRARNLQEVVEMESARAFKSRRAVADRVNAFYGRYTCAETGARREVHGEQISF